jgi:hypothetical protein
MPSTRRDLLRGLAGLGLAGSVGLAGCADTFGGTDDGRAEVVPAGVSRLGYANTGELLGDTALREAVEDALPDGGGLFGTPGPTIEGSLDRIETATGLDPRRLSEVVGFADPGGTGVGAVVWSDFSASALRRRLSENAGVRLQERSYRDRTLYGREGLTLGVLGGGRFAVGDETAVRRVVDLRDGAASGLGTDSPLGAVYDDTRGMVRGVSEAPRAFQELAGTAVVGIDTSDFAAVEEVAGSLYRAGSERGLELALVTRAEASASGIVDALTAAKAVAVSQLERFGGRVGERERFERVRAAVESTTVAQTGTGVVVEYSARPAAFVSTVRVALGLFGLVSLTGSAGGGAEVG